MDFFADRKYTGRRGIHSTFVQRLLRKYTRLHVQGLHYSWI